MKQINTPLVISGVIVVILVLVGIYLYKSYFCIDDRKNLVEKSSLKQSNIVKSKNQCKKSSKFSLRLKSINKDLQQIKRELFESLLLNNPKKSVKKDLKRSSKSLNPKNDLRKPSQSLDPKNGLRKISNSINPKKPAKSASNKRDLKKSSQTF